MKPSEILRAAAVLIDQRTDAHDGYYTGCGRIAQVMGHYTDWDRDTWEVPESVMAYLGLVAPPKIKVGETWWGNDGPRIIGLCLAAAIAEGEGH